MTSTFKRKIKFFKSSIEKNFFKYIFSLIFKNWIFRILFILGIISSISIPVILVATQNNKMLSFFENTFLIISIPFIFSILNIAIMTIISMLNTKSNNIDLFMSMSPIKDKKILYIKQLVIFTISTNMILALFITSIIFIILGLPFSIISIFFISMAAGIILLNIFWIFLFSWVSIYSKHIPGVLAIVFISFISLILSLLPTLVSNPKEMSFEFNSSKYKENLVKIYSLDNSGKAVKSSYAIYENPSALNERETKFFTPSSLVKYSPFNSIFGFSSNVLNSSFNNGDINLQDHTLFKSKYSTSYLKSKETFFDDINDYKNFSISGISDKRIFDFNSKVDLFENIDNKILDSDIIKSKIKDETYWLVLLNELKARNIWNKGLTNQVINILKHLTGINTTSSTLYDVFTNYDIVYDRYLDGIYNYFEKKYSKEFSEFIKHVWSDNNVKLNVYSYSGLGNNEFEKYHPSLLTFNDVKKANIYDINYIKNIFFKFNKAGTMQILNEKSFYSDVMNYKNIFKGHTISSKLELDNYIDSHNTVNDLRNIIKLADAFISENAHKVHFRNNVANNLILNRKVNLEFENKFPINIIYIIGLLLIALVLQKLTLNKVTKGDMK